MERNEVPIADWTHAYIHSEIRIEHCTSSLSKLTHRSLFFYWQMPFAVVIWNRIGSSLLPEEQVEALPIKKLVIDGGVAPDSKCQMQFEQEMWYGMISSLHGKPSFSVQTVL